MVNMFPSNEHPDVYQRNGDGSWNRCVWNTSKKDYVCFEVDASEVPMGNFALLQPQGGVHPSMPTLSEKD